MFDLFVGVLMCIDGVVLWFDDVVLFCDVVVVYVICVMFDVWCGVCDEFVIYLCSVVVGVVVDVVYVGEVFVVCIDVMFDV